MEFDEMARLRMAYVCFPRCVFAQLRWFGQTLNYDPTSFPGAILSGNPSKVTKFRLTTWDDAYYTVFWTFPSDFPKEIGPVFKFKKNSCDVSSGWRCNLCLMVQLLKMSLMFPEATWCITSSDGCFPMDQNWLGTERSWDWWRKSTSKGPPKIPGWGVKMSPDPIIRSLLLGIFWEPEIDMFQLGSHFRDVFFCHRSPSKSMHLKVIRFLLAGAHPLRANAVEHLGIAVSETLRDARTRGHQKTSSQNILYSCSDRCFLILFQALPTILALAKGTCHLQQNTPGTAPL